MNCELYFSPPLSLPHTLAHLQLIHFSFQSESGLLHWQSITHTFWWNRWNFNLTCLSSFLDSGCVIILYRIEALKGQNWICVLKEEIFSVSFERIEFPYAMKPSPTYLCIYLHSTYIMRETGQTKINWRDCKNLKNQLQYSKMSSVLLLANNISITYVKVHLI